MQRAIIVYSRYHAQSSSDNIDDLNRLLQSGWTVVSANPMSGNYTNSSHDDNYHFASLVILEK